MEETQGRPGCFRGGGLSAAATLRLDRWLSRQNPAYRTDRTAADQVSWSAVSLSKKSLWDFFDCALRARILPDGKIRYPKKPENRLFRTLADPIRGGPCPLELPCCSVTVAFAMFFDRLAADQLAGLPPCFVRCAHFSLFSESWKIMPSNGKRFCYCFCFLVGFHKASSWALGNTYKSVANNYAHSTNLFDTRFPD